MSRPDTASQSARRAAPGAALLAFAAAFALGGPARAQTDAGPAQAADGGGKKAQPIAPSISIEESDAKAELPPLPVGEEKRAIGDYIHGHSGGIEDCYRARVRERPTLQGKLIVHFQIGPNGHVIGATADGIADAPLNACVLGEVRKWEFEKPASGGKLRAGYPYVFQPQASQ